MHWGIEPNRPPKKMSTPPDQALVCVYVCTLLSVHASDSGTLGAFHFIVSVLPLVHPVSNFFVLAYSTQTEEEEWNLNTYRIVYWPTVSL